MRKGSGRDDGRTDEGTLPDAVPHTETLEEKMTMQILETERLILRPWRESDADKPVRVMRMDCPI